MEISTEKVREMLNKAMDESLKNVQEEPVLADAYDKMFNFGVRHMFYAIWEKIFAYEREEG